jgi:DNA-directed RNA polymerase subunit E"
MAKKARICKKCLSFMEGDKCPLCGSTEFAENFKGKIIMLKPEQSEIAKKANLAKKGVFAIKI